MSFRGGGKIVDTIDTQRGRGSQERALRWMVMDGHDEERACMYCIYCIY
jgi:hypothetical protein